MQNSWSLVKLGEVLTERKDKPDQQAILKGEIPIVSKIKFDTGTIELRIDSQTKTNMILIQPGDLVISGINAAKGAIGIYSKENKRPAAATIHYSSYIPNTQKIDLTYLWYFLRSKFFRNIVTTNLPKGIKTEIKPSRFLSLKISIPALVEEQTRVVSLWNLQKNAINQVINLIQEIIGEANLLMDASISTSCYGGKYPIVRFKEILLEAKNGLYRTVEFWGEGIPCIRMYNIEGPEINKINLKKLIVTDEELEVYSCRPGDLIFNRINSPELVGKTGIIPNDYPLCTFEAMNIRLRLDTSKALPEFVAIILNSRETRTYYLSKLKKQCGMATLNHSHINSIPFPLPSTLEEQKKIVKRLTDLRAKICDLKQLVDQVQVEMGMLIEASTNEVFMKC